MSIFQCERCGCVDNTACGVGMFYHAPSSFDWSYAPEREGMKLCSACGPTHLKGGHPTITEGKWHDLFKRVFLPMGLYVTNQHGNLVTIDKGNPKYTRHQLHRAKFPVTRPVENRQVHVWDETDKYLGIGKSVETALSGIAIQLDDRSIDSNTVTYWSYADEQNQPG